MTKTYAEALAAYSGDQDLRAARMRLGVALPDDGWLGRYVSVCTALTDAPVEFHLASGLSAIAAAAGNRTWLELWGQRIFPHVWIVLVAGSSFMRKSTSIGMASDLLADSVPDALLPANFSLEGLLDYLSAQPSGLLVQHEFAEFRRKLDREHMKSGQQSLTSLYDGRTFKRVTVSGGSKLISAPAMSILSASTLEWLEESLTGSDIAGGFLPRFAWVTASHKASDKGRGSGFPALERNELVRGLKRIGDRGAAAAVFEPAAEQAIDEWRQGFEELLESERHAVNITGFGSRLITMAWKFAMLYALSDDAWAMADRLTVTEGHARRAIAYVELLYRNVAGLVDDEIASTEDQRVFRRILQACGGKGSSWSALLRQMGMQSAKLRPFVSTLLERGQLEQREVTPEEVGLDRQRQRRLEWLRTVPGRAQLTVQTVGLNGHARDAEGVYGSDGGTVGQPEDEPYFPLSTHDSSYNTSVHTHTDAPPPDTHTHTRAAARPRDALTDLEAPL